MPEIKTLYVANHTHTDIGYTDHQRVIFRQLDEYLEDALDIIEATADYPEDTRFRWTLEVTGPVEHWLRHASPAQIERLQKWNAEGAMDIGAMQYNTTPLLNVEQMIRTLLPVRRLREEYGFRISSAMQDDVNGVSWLFADLLPSIGLDTLTLAINQVRGRAPKPLPGAFWWEGPAGGRLLTWNGLHYLFGRSVAKLADPRYVDRDLAAVVKHVEEDPDYPFDFLYMESTHPVRVDNGPPELRMSEFAREWNESGKSPRIVFTTPTEFGKILRERHGDDLPVWRGDWTDWWSDGAGSAAFETGLNRTSHELLGAAEQIASWVHNAGGVRGVDPKRIRELHERMSLFDEHTWGAFSSIARPDSLFTKAIWSTKAGFAYDSAMDTHDVLARAANKLAADQADLGAESRFNLGDLPYDEAFPDSGSREWLVINTLPFARRARVHEPEVRAGGAPRGMLDMFFPRDVPWGGAKSLEAVRAAEVELPANGWSWVRFDDAAPSETDLVASGNRIENAHYAVEVDPATGGLLSWHDKELDHDFAGEQDGHKIGEYIYELMDGNRLELFDDDYSHWDFGGWPERLSSRRFTPTTVTVGTPVIDGGAAVIEVRIEAEGINGATCRYTLESGVKALQVDWMLDKIAVHPPESVYFSFPFAIDGDARYRADVNGVALTPDEEQLNGSVRDFTPLRRWVDLSSDAHGVTLVPLDAPLVQLGGINTGKAQYTLEPEGDSVYSWALNNHWMVNFQAEQDGEIPLRYRLTTHSGGCDDVAAAHFAADVSTPALVLRDWLRHEGVAETGQFLQIDDDGIELASKLAEDGDGIILRLHDQRGGAREVPLRFTAANAAGRTVEVQPTSLLEEDSGASLSVQDGAVRVPIPSRGVVSLRVRGA